MADFSADALGDIQGLLLSGYAHLYSTAYNFLQIADSTAGRDWLAGTAPLVTTAAPWDHLPDGTLRKPRTALNVAFTFAGLRKLGLPKEALNTFEPEFSMGAAARAAILGDTGASAPEQWEIGGPKSQEIDAVVIVNAHDDAALDVVGEDLRKRMSATDGGVTLVDEQRGFRPPSNKEAFGFHDSISQPVIERGPRRRSVTGTGVATGEFILGYLNGYGEYPLTPGVTADHDRDDILPSLPGAGVAGWRDLGRHGTFMVYRKLAQDIAGFWHFFAANAGAGAGVADPQEMIRLAAKCVGRWPSGAPLTLAPDADDPSLGRDAYRNNEFLFQPSDASGFRCPIGAHIRRANPRDSRLNHAPAESLTTSNRHRILRRGTYFGTDLFPREDVEKGELPMDLHDDGRERGLHFVALGASIRQQFEFVQTTWLNQTAFNGLFDDRDPIAGANDGTDMMTLQAATVRRRLRGVPRFVNVRGACYFFLPSLTAIRYLASAPAGASSP